MLLFSLSVVSELSTAHGQKWNNSTSWYAYLGKLCEYYYFYVLFFGFIFQISTSKELQSNKKIGFKCLIIESIDVLLKCEYFPVHEPYISICDNAQKIKAPWKWLVHIDNWFDCVDRMTWELYRVLNWMAKYGYRKQHQVNVSHYDFHIKKYDDDDDKDSDNNENQIHILTLHFICESEINLVFKTCMTCHEWNRWKWF